MGFATKKKRVFLVNLFFVDLLMHGWSLMFIETPSLDPETWCYDGRYSHTTQVQSRLDFIRCVCVCVCCVCVVCDLQFCMFDKIFCWNVSLSDLLLRMDNCGLLTSTL